VLAGLVGDDYWIYLNGHVVDAPPREKRERFNEKIMVSIDDGNRKLYYLDDNHWINIYLDGKFTTNTQSYIDRFVDPASGDANHLFYPVDLRLIPGKYAVEVAYLTHGQNGGNSFPFVLTERFFVDIDSSNDRKTEYIGVPNDWDVDHARAELAQCTADGGGPELGLITEDIKNYLNDPVVHALQRLDFSMTSGPKGLVVLNLPEALGGVREFDRNQIKYMANEILENYQEYPSHETVADCKKNNAAEFSESYDEYDKLISDFESQLQFFHSLKGE